MPMKTLPTKWTSITREAQAIEVPEYGPYSSRFVRRSIILLFILYIFVICEMVVLGRVYPFLWVFIPDLIHLIDEATSLVRL